jgi:hypothetical protein
MNSKILLTTLALIPIILSIGIIPNISLVDAFQPKDAETKCIDGKVLVYRLSASYVCVSEATADRWEALGIAERVVQTEESMEDETMEETMTDDPTIAKILEKIENGERISDGEMLMLKKAAMAEAVGDTIEQTYPQGSVDPQGTASFGLQAHGTITSIQDPGVGHESHQLAIILPPSPNVYVGKITYSASEPVQYVTLSGPLAEEDIGGQPTWTADGETHYALTLVDMELASGGWFFAGNALALHTMNPTPFSSSYSAVYAEVAPGEYSQGTVGTGTVQSIQDPGIGHEDHSIALILPPRDEPYTGGVIAYSASEDVQLVALVGPLADDEMLGQPTWTADGETHYALTLIEGSNMGVWNTFSGNALALHTTNPDGFTASYTLAGLH